MAKTTAPLFSLGASGKLSRALSYGSWRGISHVRPRFVLRTTRRGFRESGGFGAVLFGSGFFGEAVSSLSAGSLYKKIPSLAQSAHRRIYQQAISTWRGLTSEEKQIYNDLESLPGMTGFNRFMRQALRQS